MSIGQVLLSNTFNEFRITVNDISNTVNSLTADVLSGDIVANTITVGQISSNLIPDANLVYDLGSTTNRWKDLYLSGNTIFLGDAEISFDGANVVFEVGGVNVFDSANINASNIAFGTLDVNRLDDSGVGAGNYGGASQVPVLVIDEKGRITSASNTEIALADTAVTPGTYGSASQVPVLVIDEKGRITSASNTNVAGVTSFDYFSANTDLVINTADGGSFTASLGASSANGASTIVVRDGAGSFAANTVTANTFVGDGSLLTGLAGGGGSGLFNTAIGDAVGYELTDIMDTAYTAPATADQRYIIHSIHITNIGVDSADVTGQFSGTTYSDITFGDTVPVPVGSSVELLKKPKILQPNDLIQLQASANTTLHATVTLEAADDATYFGRGVDVTSSATYIDLYIATDDSVLESVLLSNDDAGVLDVKATVVWTDASDNIQGYFAFDLIVPNDATIEILEQPKFIESGYKVRVQANQADRLEAIIAGKTV